MTRVMDRPVERRGETSDVLAEVDRRPGIPARPSARRWWHVLWLPDLDDPIRALHEKTWGLMAVAGACLAGGTTMAAVERPELGVWVAALLGAFGGILALPLIAILVRLSLLLLAGGAAAAAVHLFA